MLTSEHQNDNQKVTQGYKQWCKSTVHDFLLAIGKRTRNSSGDEKPAERDFYLRRHRTHTTKYKNYASI